MRRSSKGNGGRWPKRAGASLVWVLVAALFLYKLGSLTHGLSADEAVASRQSDTLHGLLNSPLFLPLHLLQWGSLIITQHHWAFGIRLASVLFGLLAVAAFWYVARRWYGVRTGMYVTGLFVISAWTLHVSRYGSDSVMYFWAIPALLALPLWWNREGNAWPTIVGTGLVVPALLYVPGVFWLLAVVMTLQHETVAAGWSALRSNGQRAVAVSLPVVLLLPLVWAFVRTPQLIARWLGWPATHDSLWHMTERLGLSITYLFYQGPRNPGLWLDRQPILGIFVLVLLVLGGYFYLRHIKTVRSQVLLVLAVLSAVLFALMGIVAYSLIIPLAYIVAGAGLGYLIHEWKYVFPRNPLARTFCYVLVSLVVALSAVYGLRSYFVAWPHNEATVRTFSDR